MNAGCDGPTYTLPQSCSDFLKGSEKARQQWELERRFHAFELKESQLVEAYPH